MRNLVSTVLFAIVAVAGGANAEPAAAPAGMPLLIDSASFVVYAGGSDVEITNTSPGVISHIELTVTDCWHTAVWSLMLDGELQPNEHKSLPVMWAYWISGAKPHVPRVSNAPRPLKVNRVIITGIHLRTADGETKTIDDVKSVLEPRIPNYCPARVGMQHVEPDGFVH